MADSITLGTVDIPAGKYTVNLTPVTPPPPEPPPARRKLMGGWRLVCPFARGGMAIDFSKNILWLVGHAQRNEVLEYHLPGAGQGDDTTNWPIVQPTRTIPGWWPAEHGYANGLCWWQGTLWVAPRVFYATNPLPVTTAHAQDGRKLTINLPPQAFSGFVKTGVDQAPYLGCGGYESGQGSVSGPTLARLDGTVLISYQWPALPGDRLENWDKRAPREPNYYPTDHKDDWSAWTPRVVNSKLEGRWACDHIWGGGLVLPEGVTYWAEMGTGEINYAWQTVAFAKPGSLRTYVYRYDANSYRLLGWEVTDLGRVAGQEIGPDGRIYLCETDGWQSDLYRVDPVIRVYG